MIERKVYQCEHCKQFKTKPRIYFSTHDMYLHERSCFYNLENKTCFTCKHNETKSKNNYCQLHIKDELENSVFFEEQKGAFGDLIPRYWGRKDGCIAPISKQIKTHCDKWENAYEVDTGEV